MGISQAKWHLIKFVQPEGCGHGCLSLVLTSNFYLKVATLQVQGAKLFSTTQSLQRF